MGAQKERINDLKAIKRIKKTNELNTTIDNYKEIEVDICQLEEEEEQWLNKLKKIAEWSYVFIALNY